MKRNKIVLLMIAASLLFYATAKILHADSVRGDFVPPDSEFYVGYFSLKTVTVGIPFQPLHDGGLFKIGVSY